MIFAIPTLQTKDGAETPKLWFFLAQSPQEAMFWATRRAYQIKDLDKITLSPQPIASFLPGQSPPIK